MFQIRKESQRPKYSLTLPASTDNAFFADTIIVSSLSNPNGIAGMARGIACQESTTVMGQAVRADGTGSIVGFITRNATVGGPTLADVTMPNRTALPFADGHPGSFEYAEEYVAGNYAAAGMADGYDHITVSGPGAVASNTAINTPLSFSGGKTCKAVSGQFSEFALVSTTETMLNDAPSGALIIRARRIPGYKIP